MPKIDGGFTIWARKTLESEIFVDKPSSWFKLWFYLVMTANWSNDKKIPRGTIHTKYEWITSATGIKRNQIDSFMRHAKAADMCSTRKTTRGFIITLLRYAEYQDIKNYKTDTKTDSRPTAARQETDRILKKGIRKERNLDKSKRSTTSLPKEPMNQDIDRSFPRTRLYGNEQINWFLDYWEFKMERKLGGSEVWNRRYAAHVHRKVGAKQFREVIDWLADPSCWWHTKLNQMQNVHKNIDSLIQQMQTKSRPIVSIE